MKISAASLLIAIAGFLQESKCMFAGLDEKTGTVVVTMDNHEFTGNLYKVWEDIPKWLVSEPSQPFQYYDVHFRGCSLGRHEAFLRGSPRTPDHQLNRVQVRIGNVELDSYNHEFKHYVYGSYLNLIKDCMGIGAVDHVYITVPKTKKVFYIQLETPGAHQARQKSEERERQVV